MKPNEYLEMNEDKILRLGHYTGLENVGRGKALILDKESQIAIMLEDCGFPDESGVHAGSVVAYLVQPTSDEDGRILGIPGTVRP